MKLATLRIDDDVTRAVRVEPAGSFLDLRAPDLDTVLRDPDWRRRAEAARTPFTVAGPVRYAPVVRQPGKIICVGLNYRTHILEMGRELPTHPTLFAKYSEALIGAGEDIALPPESDSVDWEAELAVVIGAPARRVDEVQAIDAIAGFAVLNDVTMRDWQYRSPMWLQGKTWERSTPFGPHLVTADELPGGARPSLTLSCTVDGETVQKADTADLVFDPVALVRYVSTILTLRPGDVIATGTPGGVGHARAPRRYLRPGSSMVTEISGLGRCVNSVVAENRS